MVGLVLNDFGHKPAACALEPAVVLIRIRDGDRIRSLNFDHNVGNAQASFFHNVGTAFFSNDGIDDDKRAVADIDDKNLFVKADLRGGQADAFVKAHGFDHGRDQKSLARSYIRDHLRFFTKDRVAVGSNS